MSQNASITRVATPILLIALLTLSACQSAYFGMLEALGKPKRDLLVSRVEAARDDQQLAKEQFKDALTRFSEVTNFKGGDLEAKYSQLKSELSSCESRADDVSSRIRSVESVADALFTEWQNELAQYTNADLRTKSEGQLRATQLRYNQLISAMKKAESKMQPVLSAFKDQVLFLKHNLNAQAIASLQGNVASIESDVNRLIADMEASIKEANTFIESMGKS